MAMTDIKLWYSPGACSLAPHVLLHEIAASFEAIETPVSTGATLTDAFSRINPKQRVPVLALDGDIITELPAIAAAISSLSPEHHLMGRTPLDRVRAVEWMNWLSGTLHGQGFGCLWRPGRFTDDAQAFDGIREKGRNTISGCFDMIEQKLQQPYAVGGAFTAVDPFLLVFHRWGSAIGMEMATRYPRYSAFALTISERTSVKSALIAEGNQRR